MSRLVTAGLVTLLAAAPVAGATRNIMLTGFWPNTNEMLRPWSPSPAQNPAGWIGQDWEGRGYDVHAYFPEFPNGLDGDNARGVGDFEVDYQDTSADFWRVTAELDPVAIITFSRGADDRSWELESRQINWAQQSWNRDYLAPRRPSDDLPIASEPVGMIRNSSLPMDDIRAAVSALGLGLNAFIDTSNAFGGRFVSNFIGYHADWYHDLHDNPADPAWNIAAGHIHVGGEVGLDDASAATAATLRTLTTYLDTIIPEPSTACLGFIAAAMTPRRRR